VIFQVFQQGISEKQKFRANPETSIPENVCIASNIALARFRNSTKSRMVAEKELQD
jgi:hypothetical protein